ncbi:hypothetical protein, partial [Neorhizobium galegae]|uniref:hypothetical protein n=1 Tax=Neorhizobium galegae TaxID=399 RepID=UPI001AE42C2A
SEERKSSSPAAPPPSFSERVIEGTPLSSQQGFSKNCHFSRDPPKTASFRPENEQRLTKGQRKRR